MNTKIVVTDKCKSLFLQQRFSQINRLPQANWLDVFNDEINQLEKCITPDTKNVFDIGSGLGFVSFLLFERMGRKDIHFYLLDANDEVNNRSNRLFCKQHNFYNSFEISEEIIEESNLPRENFHFVDANNWSYQQLPQMDLIYSFASWGFHYPVDTYLHEVMAISKPGTILMMDVCVDERAGFCEPERKISSAFRTLPRILQFSYGDKSQEVKKELAHLVTSNTENYHQPVGSRLLSCRFQWKKNDGSDLFQED